MFHSFWKSFELTFESNLRALEYHKTLVDEQFQIYLRQLNSFQMLQLNQQYQRLRDDLHKKAAHQEAENRRQNMADTQTWLAAASPIREHEAAIHKRSGRQSGSWLFHKPQMINWKDHETPDFSILWLYGIPGAGESVAGP
jgi:hypothetical protein